MAKAKTSKKSKTKAELLQEAVAKAVGAGKELHLASLTQQSRPQLPRQHRRGDREPGGGVEGELQRFTHGLP